MSRIYVNNYWQFADNFDEKMLLLEYDSPEFSTVRLPHTVKELPYNYFSEELYQFISTYRRIIHADPSWQGRRVLITFEGVAHFAEVFLNGKFLADHACGYTAFTVDLTDSLVYGEDNLLVLKVDSRESLNVPPFGNVIDYMTYGGIYREVYLEVKAPTYISDSFHKAHANGELHSEITVYGEISDGMSIRQRVLSDGTELHSCEVEAMPLTSIETRVENVKPWDVDHPYLYEVLTELCLDGSVIDSHSVRAGFRDAEFRSDGFYLNEKKLKLRGLNRHQSYAYVGYAMPKTMQELDADILKCELGLNAVRTSHYPQSHHFVNRCDEIGLLVVTEIPGWQHIGDSKWQDQAVKNTEEMVLQYRNHPSIILWGVRINESQDNDSLYERTNAVAHRLDSTRATCGVRNFKKSHLLEDVYTYNEFLHDGKKPGCDPKSKVTSDKAKPYLITEYNGHMFPTKSFDCEDHRAEHALRHIRVLNSVASYDDICGSFGWCMADYNTHKDFGSGDRICYHGVLDMFRNHKLAAAAYSSQGSTPVLKISSSMDIGEHPACTKGSIWAFTNADSIKMYKNGSFIKEYFPTDTPFDKLPHGPILINDFIGDQIVKNGKYPEPLAREITYALNHIAMHGYGNLPPRVLWIAFKCVVLHKIKISEIVDLYTKYAGDWGGTSTEYRFDAIMQSKVVKSVTKTPMNEAKLSVQNYKNTLIEGATYDVTEIRMRAEDEHGNLLNYSSEPIKLEVSGDIEIIGDSVISLRGGMGGVYVRTKGKSGQATVRLISSTLGTVEVPLTIIKDESVQSL